MSAQKKHVLTRQSISRQHLTAGIVNLGVVLLFVICLYPKAFLPGYDLSGLNGLAAFSPWKHSSDNQGTYNPLLGDVVTQFIPWDMIVRESLLSGNIPHWNPYNSCGEPLLANGQSAVFYPLSFISRFFPHPFLCRVLLKLFCCQLGMYFFLRQLSLSFWSCLAGGFLFTFSGFNMVWLNHPHSNVSVLLPGLFCFWLLFLRRPEKRYLIFSGIIAACTLLGGHPETAFHEALLIGLFTLMFREQGYSSHRIRLLFSILVVYVIGLALAAFQIFPLLEYLFNSTAALLRPLISHSDPYYAHQIQDWEGVLGLIAPKIFGTPLDRNWCGPVNFNEINAGFVGLSGLFFASAFGLFAKSPFRNVFFAMFVVCVLFVYRIPVLETLLHWYPVSMLDHKRLLLGIAFSLSCLAALGFEQFLIMVKTPRQYCLRILLFSAFLVLFLGIHRFCTQRPQDTLRYETVFVEQILPFSAVFLVLIPVFFNRQVLKIAVLLAGIVSELFFFSRGYIPASDTQILRMQSPVLEMLRQDEELFRVAAFKTNFLFPNTNLFYHVPVLTGYDALGKRNFFEFMQTIAPCRPHPVFHLMQWSPPIASPWLDFLNTKYIVTPLGISLPDSAFTRMYPLEGDNIDSKHMLFLNKNSLSRAFLATRILGIMEPVKVRAALTAPSFDPRSSVILNIQDDYTFPVHYKDRDRCEITRYTPAEIALSVDHKEPRVLVLSDTWDPGWKAFVDGERVPVFQANLTFRGIILYQPGRHEVIFKYDPFSFRLGTMTALVTLLGTIYCLLLVGKKKSKSR